MLYADVAMLLSDGRIEHQRQVQAWGDRYERFGFKHNVKKTEYLNTDENEPRLIKVNGIQLPPTPASSDLINRW